MASISVESYQLPVDVELRPIGLDDLSNVRHVHASAMRVHGAAFLADEEMAAFTDMVYSQGYADELVEQNLTGAWIGRNLIGTAGWLVADDSGASARVRSIFVRPMFTGIGLGRGLLAAVEAQAAQAGFESFTARATLNVVRFFEAAGYSVTAHGARAVSSTVSLPIVFVRKVAGHRAAGAAGRALS